MQLKYYLVILLVGGISSLGVSYAADLIQDGNIIALGDVQGIAVKVVSTTFADIQLSDTTAGTDLKTMAFRTEDGRTRLFTLTDVGGFLSNNIFVMDHATGNIGYGIAFPAEKLDVAGKIQASGDIKAPAMKLTSSGFADIQLSDTGAGTDLKTMSIRTDDGRTRFFTLTDVGGFQADNILVMDHATGNIGFGIFAPQETVDINGNIGITGDIITTGNICIGTAIACAP